MIRNLKYFKDPELKAVCESVFDIIDNKQLQQDIQDMIDTMKRYKGCGLAAPQIGILKRVAVIERNDGSTLAMINPVIRRKSDKLISGREGCLSYPNIHKSIKRAEWIDISYFDINGVHILDTFSGLEARIIQHEICHLDGITLLNF